MPPRHSDVRLDAVVGDQVAKTKYSDLASLETKDLTYNSKLGEERIIRANIKKAQAEHLLS